LEYLLLPVDENDIEPLLLDTFTLEPHSGVPIPLLFISYNWIYVVL